MSGLSIKAVSDNQGGTERAFLSNGELTYTLLGACNQPFVDYYAKNTITTLYIFEGGGPKYDNRLWV